MAEDCKTHRNIGLISERNGELWLWVKEDPSASGAMLYAAKDRPSFKPYKNNRGSTPRGGTGYLGGRKFSDLAGVRTYLKTIAPIEAC